MPTRLITATGALLLMLAACAAPRDETSAGPHLSTPPHPDAVSFSGHWYAVFDLHISWHEAKAHCEALGGHLATITSQEEQDFITELADGRYLFLGASDEIAEDTWLWITGEPWDFTYWMEGQPNNYGGAEDYLATSDGGKWVDVDAEGDDFWMPTGFICEWSPGLSSTGYHSPNDQ